MNFYTMKTIKNMLISATTGVFVMVTLLSTAAMAEDTEIYFGGGSNSGNVRPNVLVILDTSGSMGSTDGTGISRLERMKTALHTILNNANNVNMGLMTFHNTGGGPVRYPVANLDDSISVIENSGTGNTGTGNSQGSLIASRIRRSEDDAQESLADNSVDLDLFNLEMAEVSAGGNFLVERRVSHWKDDAEETKSSGYAYRGSSDLDAGGNGNILVGIRFKNISIPSNAIINSAVIEFHVRSTNHNADPTNLTIYGEKKLDPKQFQYKYDNISNRTRTNGISWNNVSSPNAGGSVDTVDISPIISELIQQNNWDNASTRKMAFIIDGTGYREFESYDGSPSKAPLLKIDYSIGGSSDQQLVGLRFEDVGVPQGASITDAYIEFVAASDKSNPATLAIKAENVDDATSSFTTTPGSLSSRAANSTSSSVTWNPVESWTQDQHYLTPDLRTIVQEVVNRPGWCGNNAMAFFIQGGSGLREAVSSDGDSTLAPVLHINYDQNSVADNACIKQTFQAQIASSRNDVEQRGNGSILFSGTILDMTDNYGDIQTIGLRFTDVRIPKGATIVEASLDFTARYSNSGSSSLTIRGEKSDDAGAFTSAINDLTVRNMTSASTTWNPGSWTKNGTYTSPNLKTIIQEIVNQNAWNGGNNLNLIISGSGTRRAWSFDSNPTKAPVLRIKVNGKLSTGFKTVRKRLHDIVDDLNTINLTPIVDTLYEAARYYRGENVLYGTARGNAHNPNASMYRANYSRVSHPASYTGGTVVRDSSCTDNNLNSTSCTYEHITGTATYKSPITLECQNNFIILLSDGYPTYNTSVSEVQSLSGSSCSGSGDGKCGPELADFLYTQDQSSNFSGDQTIQTYTIGFNLLDAGKTYLESVATAGGGTYQDASSSADLVDAFNNIFVDVLSQPTSFAAPALSINAFTRLYHNNDVYFSLFKPDYQRRWNGNVKKYRVCPGTEVDGNGNPVCKRGEILDTNDINAIGSDDRIKDSAQSIWSLTTDGPLIQEGGAGSQVPGYSSRKLYTYTGANSPSSPVTLNSSAHKVLSSNTALVGIIGKNLFNHPAPYNTSERTDINKLIDWMRGRDVKDENDDGSTTDNRWIFSDPLHSSAIPITYGYPVDGDGKPADGGDSDDEPDYVIKLLLATNDGSFRMVNAHNGVEEWAFIPQALLEQQKELMDNINGEHIYGLDNTPTIMINDVNENGSIEPADGDFVHAYVSMRRGGRNIYAFDITPSSEITNRNSTNSISPKLMWRIDGGSGDFAVLGQTWSRPLPAIINVNGTLKDVLIFAGGYHSGQDTTFGVSPYGNAIYIVDAETGARLWWAGNDVNADLTLSDMTYAIPSDIALMDSNSDGVIDRLYVGDTGGQLWRIDLAVTLNASSGARLATVSSSATDTDKRKFFYPPDIAQMNDGVFSNTKLYDLVTITSGNRAHPLNKSVHDRFYAFRDVHVGSVIPTGFTPITASNMYDATDVNIKSGSSEADALKTKKGWYINLQEYNDDWKGEKGLASPLILDGKIFFTTYIPEVDITNDPCGSAVEGSGRRYAVNLLTGAAIYNRYQPLTSSDNNLTVEDRRDEIGSGIPTDPTAFFHKTGDIDLMVGIGGGISVFDTKIGLPRKRTFWQQLNIE